MQKLYKSVVESSNSNNADGNDKALSRLSDSSPMQPGHGRIEPLSVVLEALIELLQVMNRKLVKIVWRFFGCITQSCNCALAAV